MCLQETTPTLNEQNTTKGWGRRVERKQNIYGQRKANSLGGSFMAEVGVR